MLIRLVVVTVAVATLSGPTALALNLGATSRTPVQQDETPTAANSAGTNLPAAGSKIVVKNADDTLNHWSTCAMPDCHPGGKGVPVSTNQTINNANPSVDGASMMLTETIDSTKFFTNVLWPYKTRGCDSCTQMHTDFWAYPVSSSHVGTLEYDAFVFDGTRQLDIMWGVQWNQREGKWQIWNQATSRWIDTDVTTGPKFGAWNHLQFADHRVIGDTSCGGTECLYYDSMTLNGTTYDWNLSQPAGPIHPGWHSVSGFQFQLDASPVTSGTATVTEYIDEANMWAN
ncbi:MAG TPA: hypothetical protein VMF56_12355 [Acidobacteriaceae bacterium]|nr:hypothetical protein [Acidobacteriaceae bacterium]